MKYASEYLPQVNKNKFHLDSDFGFICAGNVGDYGTSARLPDNIYHLSCLLQKKTKKNCHSSGKTMAVVGGRMS